MFSGAVIDLAMSPNGELCCTVSDDKTAKVFDVINFGGSALFSGFFLYFIIPCGKFGLLCLGEATATTKAVPPIPAGVCSIFLCTNNGMAASVWELTSLFVAGVSRVAVSLASGWS